MSFTYSQLLSDLHTAYYDARRHKRSKPYQLQFEENLEGNLSVLCAELWWRTYAPRPSECFIISDPKKREIFAADFRDRIVHHLYYNYLYNWLERTFIADSYSCIVGRGTLYGIRRMEHHIRKVSHDYTERCYVLKMDIRGYFMHISRRRLLETVLALLGKLQKGGKTDLSREHFDFLRYLSREIIMLDPIENCIFKGNPSDWDDLPASKSLFNSPLGCGLPIGNLTSQLFSNVHMNVFDQWMKREMKCRHYGRYVDDFYVVSCDREWLHSLIPQIRMFLWENLSLSLNDGKTRICNASHGVEFLGAYLKPHRRYVSNTTLRRMEKKIRQLEQSLPPIGCHRALTQREREHLRSSLSSMLGLMRQHKSWHVREKLIRTRLQRFAEYGEFDDAMTKFVPDLSRI